MAGVGLDGLNAKAQGRKGGDGVKLRVEGCFTAEWGMGYTEKGRGFQSARQKGALECK